ncbi:MAG TPA: serpin family protein [Verrucomicrobiae bacterium]|nr:serpin family protein [Verrucomicrobiae bacterium]
MSAAIVSTHANPVDQDKLASANTGFAFKLLTAIAKEQPEKNIFISPYSVSTVLQMVENGASGKTKAELRQALGIPALSQSAQNEANRVLSRVINAGTTNFVLNTANAIWYRSSIPVKPAFIACNQDFYQATVEALNFNDPATVGHINSWVNEKTHGKIPGMLSGPIDPMTSLYLANAVYFKGDWLNPFKVEDTKDGDFHLRGGKSKKLPMMFQGGNFSYRKGTGYQAVRLPYQGWNLGMYVFLPDADSSPEKLLAIMNGDNWRRVTVPGFKDREGTLALPRFKFEYGVDLKKPLQALGIQKAFLAKSADFSSMCSEPVFISEASQKAFVEVNEKGTEAAAVTMVEAMALGIEMNPPKPFQMIVDRPFLFVIEHGESKTILFMGVVFDPSLAE